MTINVTQENDKSFTISWDENDPKESILNNWTEEDFIKVITDSLQNTEVSQQETTNTQQQLNVRKDEEEYRTPRLFF